MLKMYYSPLEPDEVRERLESFVAREDADESNPERAAKEKPLLGKFEPDRFTVHRRVTKSRILSLISPIEWFKPFVYGFISKNATGSRIDIEGSWRLLVKVIWIALIAGAAGLIGLVTVFGYPYTITHDPEHSASNLVTGMVLIGVVSGICLILPVVGWFLTRSHLEEIGQELKSRLQLREG
jgi:hypothetical protein